MYSYLLPRNYPNTQYQRGQQAQQPAEPAPIGHRGLVTQPTQPISNRNAHAWRLTGFTQCTHSCAGGSTSSANHFHLSWFVIVDNDLINLSCYVAGFLKYVAYLLLTILIRCQSLKGFILTQQAFRKRYISVFPWRIIQLLNSHFARRTRNHRRDREFATCNPVHQGKR